MLQFHNESKPSLFDYVLRISINQKAQFDNDFRDSPYVTEILYPISDQEIQLPKTFQGIGLFFFTDVKDKYLTKGHSRFELQWTEYSSFSFCLTDEKKNIYFVFAYLHSSSVYCVISDYYHPAFLSDFIYVLSISKNPSEFAQKINDIVIKSSNQHDDDQYYHDDETFFVHDQYDWFFRIFQSENSDSGSSSAYSLPIQGPRSTSSSNMTRNNKIQLLSSKRMSNLSTAKITTPTKQSDFSNHLYGISHTNHMSPENEICELYKFIFSDLPVEYILMLIDAILLDFKIIIISNDVAKLGKAAFAIIGLIYPLKWPGSFIPVCPESMSTFLEAPFPYIIGIHSSLSMKLLEGDNMVYCVYNVDAHYVANIGIEDFPPSVCNYIDLVAEKIKSLIHSYSPLFPFVHVQREIRNFIKGTLANSYGLDPNDFGYKELMADFVVWRDESSSEYAAYFSQSQTVDNFMRSLENSEYEKDDRVFKAFFPNETFMGTVHIPRQLVEESIEKEKEDGIKINIADLQMLSKSYPKTAVKVNNDRLVTFDSSNKQKEEASPKKNDNQNQVQIKIESNNSSTNASDSESSHKSASKHKHKHKRHLPKTLRSSMPVSKASDLDDELKQEAETDYPIDKKLSGVSISSDDESLSLDDNINIEKIISSDGKKTKSKKKYRNSSRVKNPVSTFSVDSASDADQSNSTSESEDSKKQLKSKRRTPPDLPAIPSKKKQEESETKKKPAKKKKNSEDKKEKKKTTTKKSKSKAKSEGNSESENKTESESESEKKKKISQPQKSDTKTVLIIESDSDVGDSSNNDSFNDSDDYGNWSSSSSSPPRSKALSEPQSKSVPQRYSDRDDSDGFSSSSSTSGKKQTKKTENKADNQKLKKRKPYKFDSDSDSKSNNDIKNDNDDDSIDYESESNKIRQNENESILKMMKKSKISDSNSDDDDKNAHSFIDSPIPKKKSKYVQESDLISNKSKNRNKNLRDKDDANSSNDDESDDSNDPSLKKKYKRSSDMNQSQKKSKGAKKRKNKYDSNSDDESNKSSNSDDSD